MQSHFHFDFILHPKSLLLCRHQEWGRRSISESTICPGALLLETGRTVAPLDHLPKGLWLQPHIVSLCSVPIKQHPHSHPQLPQTSFTVGHQWWPCWWHPSSFGCWRWWLSLPWPSPRLGWAPPAGSSKDSCPDNGVLGGAASESLPASWWVEMHPEGNWHFVQSTVHGLSSWELTCVKQEQLCCAPALISWWLSKVQPILGV